MPRGYDADKKVQGRKRHIVVDTVGLVLAVVVHPANIQALRQAQEGRGQPVISKLAGRFFPAEPDLGGWRIRWKVD